MLSTSRIVIRNCDSDFLTQLRMHACFKRVIGWCACIVWCVKEGGCFICLVLTRLVEFHGLDLVPEVEDELVVDGRVDVLGQLHEEEPVAVVDVVDDAPDVDLVVGLGPVAQQHGAAVGGGEADHPEDHVDAGPDGHGDEPEPQEDVDLLVDDVVGQHAEAILVLHRAGGTILVEGALGDLGEHLVQGVGTFLEWLVADGKDLSSISGKLASQEDVHQVNLNQNVHKVEQLAEDELEDIRVVMMNSPLEIFDQQVFLAVQVRWLLDVLFVESLRNEAKLASLPRLPEVVGHVAEHRLQEQDEADPLVPRVANFVSIL